MTANERNTMQVRDGQRDEQINLEFDRVGQWMYAKGESR